MASKRKLNVTVQILALLGLILIVNLFASSFFGRADLTDDKRHTISDYSAQLLNQIEHPAFITIYYGGELPLYYKSFEEGMANLMEEMALSSDGNFDYQFVNPQEDPELIERFKNRGFPAIPISTPTSFTSQEQTLVLPYAMVTYQDRDVMINLIQNCYRWNQDGTIEIFVGEALRRFEYKIMAEVHNLSRTKYKTIGMLTGHGEYPKEALGDLYEDIDHYYNFIEVDLRKGVEMGPSNLDLLLIPQPESALSEREKYEIDQYIMRGGQVILLADFERVDFKVGEQRAAMSFLRETNLDDLLMKHGVKLNYNLLNDPSHGKLALGSFNAAFGNENVQANWPFFPKIWDLSPHPTTRFIGSVLMRYASSIDTFYTEDLKKTVLMRTSSPTRIRNGVQFIDLNDELRQIKAGSDRSFYNQPGQITGLLVEGKFNSLYQGRPAPTDSMAPNPPLNKFAGASFPDQVPRLAVISDGDFAKAIRGGDGKSYLPLENKLLMMNLLDYMTGQDILTKLRPRAYNNRMLDPEKVVGNQLRIQLINIGLPLLIVLIFGIGRGYLRKRRNRPSAFSNSPNEPQA